MYKNHFSFNDLSGEEVGICNSPCNRYSSTPETRTFGISKSDSYFFFVVVESNQYRRSDGYNDENDYVNNALTLH